MAISKSIVSMSINHYLDQAPGKLYEQTASLQHAQTEVALMYVFAL